MSAGTSLRTRRTRLIVGGLLGAAVLAPVTWAFASFFGSGTSDAQTAADVLAAPAAPLASRAARNTIISWTSSATSDGVTAATYSVTREPDGGGASSPVTCASAFGFQCTDIGVPTGTWRYRVTAHLLTWDSAPSSPSAAVPIDTPTFTIKPGQVVRGGAPVLGGTFSNFQAGEAITVASSPGNAVIGHATALADGSGTVDLTVGTLGGTFTPIASGPSGTATSPITYEVDVVAPATSISLAGTLGTSGWYTSDVVVTLTADDPSAEISYTVDTPIGLGAPQPYEGPFTLDADGSYTLHYGATDDAGNAETVHVPPIRIDSTAPVPGTLTVPANIKGDFVLSMSATDPTPASGVGDVTYFYCTGTPCNDVLIGTSTASATNFQVSFTPALPADGSYRVRARVTDVAGNTTFTTRQAVLLDTKAPTGRIVTPLATSTIGGSSVTFAATAGDDPASLMSDSSGVRNVVFEYRLKTTPESTWTTLRTLNNEPLTFTRSMLGFDNGSYELHLVVTDRAGNQFTTAPTPFSVENWGASTVALTNVGGLSGRGLLQVGDAMVVTFDQAIRAGTMCPTWVGDASAQSLVVNAQLTNGPGGTPDTLVMTTPGGCVPNAGSLVLGSAAYVTGPTVTFTGSTLTWNPGTKQLTLTLGTPDTSAAITKVDVNTNATYQPSASLVSVNGVPINPRTIRTGPGRQF